MNKKLQNSLIISVICVITDVLLLVGACIGYSYFNNDTGRYEKESFRYLAIGNSITKHDITDFWWNEVGMAASDADHDYYHIVLEYLKKKHQDKAVSGEAFNFKPWEVEEGDRSKTLSLLDGHLATHPDLITVMLAENVTGDLSTYEDDYVCLLKYLQEKAPNARILVVGDFWSRDNRNELKINAVRKVNAEYVSLEGIADNEQYYCGLGTTVYDKDGVPHTVENEGVAMHPGDKGMELIAERIIEVIAGK